MGVGVERNVGDRAARDDEIVARAQMSFHDAERGVARGPLVLERRALGVVEFEVLQPETRGGDVRLVAVLLEEHPAQRFGAAAPVVEQDRRKPHKP